MKNYKMKDLLTKTQKDLAKDLLKLQSELNEIKVDFTNRKISDDTSKQVKIKKQVARLKTAINQLNKESKSAK